jgi:hypothetical protein
MNVNRHDEYEAIYSSWSLPQLARHISGLREELDRLTAERAALSKLYDWFTINLVPEKMAEQDIQSMKIENVGRLQLRPDAWVRTVDKDALFEWVRKNKFDSVITETINAGTLKALIKSQINDCDDIPPEDAVTYTPYVRAIVVKS